MINIEDGGDEWVYLDDSVNYGLVSLRHQGPKFDNKKD